MDGARRPEPTVTDCLFISPEQLVPLHIQLNISFSLWHKAAKGGERQGPVTREFGDWSPVLAHQLQSRMDGRFGPSPPRLLAVSYAACLPFYTKSKFHSIVKFTELPKSP